jgi:riboflavin transporter FmnP
MKQVRRKKSIAYIGILAALGMILSYLEIPVPLMPPFMKLDISEVPSVIGLMAFGLPSSILISAVKNLIHLTISESLGIGEICNFLVALSYLLGWHLMSLTGYRRFSYVCAAVSMTATAVILNISVLLPLYETAFHISEEQILALTRAGGLPVSNIYDYILFVIVPFNILKGAVIGITSSLLWKHGSSGFAGRS